MNAAVTVQTLRAAARALDTGDHRAALVAIQTAQDALDAAKAHHLAALERSAEFELDGASSVTAWARDHLRLEAHQTRQYVASDATLRALPEFGAAAAAGSVRLEHVNLMTFGIKHIGQDLVADAQPWLLDVAQTHEPSQLRRVVRELRDAVYPDDLDQAWIKGMDKQDVQLSAVPEGWHLKGFLNTETGAKLKAVLDSLGAPVDKDDRRSGPERRVAALDRLATTVLQNGLPSDKGIRPQLLVTVEAETLHDALTAGGTSSRTGAPAQLAGFGPIGPRLLSYLGCVGDITPILYGPGELPQARVLNVGDTQRLATPRQRKAVIARQGGVCAGPGCRNSHLEIHHSTWWSQGGRTDLDDLVGYCRPCHVLIHRGLLVVTADGRGQFSHTTKAGRPITERGTRPAAREVATIRRIAADVRQARADFRPPLRA